MATAVTVVTNNAEWAYLQTRAFMIISFCTGILAGLVTLFTATFVDVGYFCLLELVDPFHCVQKYRRSTICRRYRLIIEPFLVRLLFR